MRAWSIATVVLLLAAGSAGARAESLPGLTPSAVPSATGESAAAAAPAAQGIVATAAPAVVPAYFAANSLVAYRSALQASKPMIVVFWQPTSSLSVRLFNEIIASHAFKARYGEKAVFVAVDPYEQDASGNADHLSRSLGITQIPVVAVLDVYADRIAERARVTGYFPYDKFITEFERMLRMPRAEQR